MPVCSKTVTKFAFRRYKHSKLAVRHIRQNGSMISLTSHRTSSSHQTLSNQMLSRMRSSRPLHYKLTLKPRLSEKYIAEQRGNWQHIDREDRAGYCWYETRSQDPQLLNCVIFKEIQTINTALWLLNVSWQITVLPQFKHVNRSSFHIYLKHEINMNKHQKVFYFNRGTHNFSSSSPPKLICSSKARRDTAAVTGHAHLHLFRADNITWNL